MGRAGAVVAPLLVARSRGRVPASPGLAVSLGSCSPFPLLYSSCRRSRCCSPDTPGSVGAGTSRPQRSSLRPARRSSHRLSQLCSRSVSLHQFQLCSFEVVPPPCLPRACGSAWSCLHSGTTAPSPASLFLGPGELIVQKAGPRAR